LVIIIIINIIIIVAGRFVGSDSVIKVSTYGRCYGGGGCLGYFSRIREETDGCGGERCAFEVMPIFGNVWEFSTSWLLPLSLYSGG